MNIWFTSDHHFSHKNIIQYENRPFSSVEDMNAYMIKVWNDHIKPGDIVYHLGDFIFYNKIVSSILQRLNGHINLVVGNHDVQSAYKYTKVKIHQYLEKKYNDVFIIMFHYPIARWRIWYHNSIHLHGHSHGNYIHELATAKDVGVDTNNYKPYHLDEILKWRESVVDQVKDMLNNNK